MNQKEEIVILGGGFAGLVFARELVRAGVVGKSCEVTVIDKCTSHTYTPWLYEVGSGYLCKTNRRSELFSFYTSASVPFRNIPGYDKVRFRQETVVGVDFQARSVFLADGLTIRFTSLVVAFGSEPNYFGIPGLPQNCTPLKSASDAIDVDRRVREVLADASPTNKKNICIIGAGPTGVEFAGELMTSIHVLEGREELSPGSITVSLIDRKEPLLGFPGRMPKLVLNRLKKIGVHVLCGVSVLAADDKALTLKDAVNNTSLLPSDLTIWSGGVMPASIVKKLGLPMDQKGKILVDAHFVPKCVEGIYALGDCAAITNPFTNNCEPMTAQVAETQAKWLAKNIIRKFSGRASRPFPFRKRWATLIAIGGKYGVGCVFGVVINGPLVFYLRRLVDGRYFFSILPWRYAFYKWLKGVVLYNKND